MTLTVEVPARNARQREEALAVANEIRSWRAALKEHMTVDTAKVLIQRPPERAGTWKVADLLKSVPKVGPVKRDFVMMSCRIGAGKTLGGLSDRQRIELSAALERWA